MAFVKHFVRFFNEKTGYISTKKQDIRIYKEMLNKLHVAIYNKGCSASSRILILIRDAIE